MLSEPPDIGFVSCKPCAVDSRLLSCSDTDSLTVLDIAYAVGLRVLQSDKRDKQIVLFVLRDILVFGYDIGQQLVVYVKLVSALFKRNAENLLSLDRVRNIIFIDFDDVICSLSF